MSVAEAKRNASAGAGTGRGPLFAPPLIAVERLSGGGMILRSPVPPNAPPRALSVWLERWAAEAPQRIFLAERAGAPAGQGWRTLTYGEALAQVRAVAQALLDRKLSPERPILILSENGIDHALIAFAGMHVGIPVAPVSTAYARLSKDFAKLRYIVDLIEPQLVAMDDPARYGDAPAAVDWRGAEIVASRPGEGMTAFADLLGTRPTDAVERANAAVGPDTVAKILFTSGSTDLPKGVINTQRMLCSNQEGIAQVWPFVEDEPPVIVDWLPWNHTFGGNHNINMMLRNGGSLYIDEGKPVPALLDRTVANLKEVAPTIYFNVPRGYGMLLDRLEADPALNENFFSRLKLIFYAGAGLPQSLWERLEACSLKARDEKVPMVSSWGMTETAPMATMVHFPIPRAGSIGIPAPGVEIKLKPSGDRLEMLARGPNVTPGYWKRPDLTEKAFDEEGWLRTGDAARFEDPGDPAKGIVFDGRVAENFKLSSGTWVNVGPLRVAVLAAVSPLIEDAVVAGHDRDEVALLAFANVAACRGLCDGLAADCPPAEVLAHAAVREAIRAAVARHNAASGGSSQEIARVILMHEPPSIDANEITDKGYVNQRAVLTRRAKLVEQLYAEPAHPDVILIRNA
ncbi:MAG TPA: feruloyl-CoA synthase [Beijerinckiaceae bacterium]|jgi:feruloyl-CoA synthase